MRRRRFLAAAGLAAVVALAAGPARAHDPFEITAEGHLRPDALALHVTMASSTAARACLPREALRTRHIPPDAWNAVRAAVEACARGRLFRLAPPASAGAVRAALTEEGDVDLTVDYPPPAPGPLRVEAPFLAGLGNSTYGVTLRITGPAMFLGDKLLRADDPALEVTIPGAPLAPAWRRHGLAKAAALLGLAALAALAIAWRRRQRRSSPPPVTAV